MKQEEIKHHIINGTLEQAIRVKNQQWFMTLVMFIIFFGCYSVFLTKRNINLSNDVSALNDTVLYKDTVIGIQRVALDSAVYFHEIKLKK